VLLLSEEDADRETLMDGWSTVVERKMDSDSLGDVGVVLLVFEMLVCVFTFNAKVPRWKSR